jgi:hypothetical protein
MATTIAPSFSMIIPAMVVGMVFYLALCVGYYGVMSGAIMNEVPMTTVASVAGIISAICAIAVLTITVIAQNKKTVKAK